MYTCTYILYITITSETLTLTFFYQLGNRGCKFKVFVRFSQLTETTEMDYSIDYCECRICTEFLFEVFVRTHHLYIWPLELRKHRCTYYPYPNYESFPSMDHIVMFVWNISNLVYTAVWANERQCKISSSQRVNDVTAVSVFRLVSASGISCRVISVLF